MTGYSCHVVTISDERPWSALPPRLRDVLRPGLPALAEEIMAAIAEAVPEYDRPMRGAFGRGVRTGVEQALTQFVDLLGAPEAAPRGGVYRALGRGEHEEGRSLDALQAAYRTGARVAWRRSGEAAAAAGIGAADPRRPARAAWPPTPSAGGPRRSSPTSTSWPRSRSRATPRRRRAWPARPSGCAGAS